MGVREAFSVRNTKENFNSKLPEQLKQAEVAVAWYSYFGSNCSLLPRGLHCGLICRGPRGWLLPISWQVQFSFQEATELYFRAIACWQGNHSLPLPISTEHRQRDKDKRKRAHVCYARAALLCQQSSSQMTTKGLRWERGWQPLHCDSTTAWNSNLLTLPWGSLWAILVSEHWLLKLMSVSVFNIVNCWLFWSGELGWWIHTTHR